MMAAGPAADRRVRIQEAEAAGERLLTVLDELGLSLSAAYLSMSLEMLWIGPERLRPMGRRSCITKQRADGHPTSASEMAAGRPVSRVRRRRPDPPLDQILWRGLTKDP